MESVNFYLFNLFNGSEKSPQYLQILAFISANAAPLFAMVIVAMYWVLARDRNGPTGVVAHAVIAATLGLAINQMIGWLWFHPRPFMIGMGHQLIAHAADSSFPSDHATLLFSMAVAFAFHKSARIWAALLLGIGLLCAWARVFAGVHFPMDMAGSLLVASIAALPAGPIARISMGFLQAALRRIGIASSASPVDRA